MQTPAVLPDNDTGADNDKTEKTEFVTDPAAAAEDDDKLTAALPTDESEGRESCT